MFHYYTPQNIINVLVTVFGSYEFIPFWHFGKL